MDGPTADKVLDAATLFTDPFESVNLTRGSSCRFA
jgi:hypothetical protein